MKSEIKHTSTPWRVLADGYIGADNPPYKTNKVVAEICSGNIADKEFIVRAVNSHEALRTIALRHMSLNEMNVEIERINTAIAEAEGKS